MIMCRLIYLSSRNTQVPLDIYDLLRVSRKNNAGLGITGFLFYDGRNFVQVLEGERAAVSDIYNRIIRDERHQNVTLMSCGEIAGREFHQWSMGLQEGLEDSARDNLLRIFSLNEIDIGALTARQIMIFLQKIARITQGLDEIGSMMALKS